jgi:CMP-N-acetylneuraminic acid synthetase
VRKLVADHQAIKGARTSAVIIQDLLVNIDTELDFKLAEFMISEGV